MLLNNIRIMVGKEIERAPRSYSVPLSSHLMVDSLNLFLIQPSNEEGKGNGRDCKKRNIEGFLLISLTLSLRKPSSSLFQSCSIPFPSLTTNIIKIKSTKVRKGFNL